MTWPRRTVVNVTAIDTRLLALADVSEQFRLALNKGSYNCISVTTTQLAKSTMTNPNGGRLQVITDLLVPGDPDNLAFAASDLEISTFITAGVTAVLTGLPFLSGFTVGTVTVFHSSDDARVQHPAVGGPVNGNP